MNNTNGMTFDEFIGQLVNIKDQAERRILRMKLKESFGPLVEVNPWRGNYTVYPRGYIFACGKETHSDVG